MRFSMQARWTLNALESNTLASVAGPFGGYYPIGADAMQAHNGVGITCPGGDTHITR
jgi:hypothetical protein